MFTFRRKKNDKALQKAVAHGVIVGISFVVAFSLYGLYTGGWTGLAWGAFGGILLEVPLFIACKVVLDILSMR